MKAKLKAIPSLRSDTDAEHFVDSADLSQYDLFGFQPASFEFEPKSAALTMRLPAPLLEALKRKAQAQGIPYTRYVRRLLEKDVGR